MLMNGCDCWRAGLTLRRQPGEYFETLGINVYAAWLLILQRLLTEASHENEVP